MMMRMIIELAIMIAACKCMVSVAAVWIRVAAVIGVLLVAVMLVAVMLVAVIDYAYGGVSVGGAVVAWVLGIVCGVVEMVVSAWRARRQRQ